MNNLLKEKSKFTYSLKVKTAQIHQDLYVKMPFSQKVAILTKIRPKMQTFLKEKSDIRPWSAKVDHSGCTTWTLFYVVSVSEKYFK